MLRLRAEGWRKQTRVLLGCILVWSAVVGAERVYARAIHGDQLTSFMGHHLFGKAALIDAPPLDSSRLSPLEQRLVKALEVDYAPVRKTLRDAEHSTAHPALLAAYEVCIQHGCTKPFQQEYGVSNLVFNAARARVGFARLRQNAVGFAQLTWREYQNLWALNSRTHPQLAPEYDAFIASARPLPLEKMLAPTVFNATSPSAVAYVVRPAFLTAGVVVALITICFGYAVATRYRSDPLVLTAFLSALSVELVFAFTALTAIGYGRYTMAMWPNIAMAIIVAVAVISRTSRGYFPAVSDPPGVCSLRASR
jgi:hypothetical protein